MADAQDPKLASLQKELELLKLRTQIAEERKKLEGARKTEEKPPADPELEEAKRAAALAEELKKARTALPEPEAKALEGKLTIDEKVTIESQTLAYESMTKIAAQIAKEVKAANAPRIVIYHDKDMASLLELRTFLAQARSIRQAFEDATPEPSSTRAVSFESVIATGALVVTAAKTLVDLVALFRTDTAITGVEVTLDDTALAASVAQKLGGVVFYPQIQPLDFSTPDAFARSEVVEVLDGLHAARQKAEAAVKREIDGLETEIADEEARKTAASLLKEPLEKADALFQPFRDALFKADETTGTNALSRLLRADVLASRLKENGSHLLYLKVVKAGGSNRITRNLFTGSKLWHSGGAIVTYLLFRSDGSIAASNTLYRHSGYKRFEAPDDLEFPLDNFSR